MALGRVLFIDAARAIELKAAGEAPKTYWATYGFQPLLDRGGPPFHLFLPMTTAEQIAAAAG